MQRIRLGFCLFMLVGCSNGDVRSEGQGAVASATVDAEVGVEADLTDEQPTVLFRCEEGRVGAYVVTGGFEEQPVEDQMVRINLDSAPRC